MSEMALQLIRQAKAEKWKSLDLGNCGIKGELPVELRELVDLEELILSNRWWDPTIGLHINSKNGGPNNEIAGLSASLPPNIRHLLAENVGLRGTAGLAFLTSDRLEKLNLRNNKLAYITPLSGLPNLASLNLSGNLILDIAPLAELRKLASLYLGGNHVFTVNPLAGLMNLETLDLSRNRIIDIKPIADLEKIQRLSLGGNQFTDLISLAGLRNLGVLYLSGNDIEEIEVLSELQKLERLDLSRNKISDIKPLAGLANLMILNISKNHVSDIQPLAGQESLIRVDFSQNPVADIQPLAGLLANGIPAKLKNDHLGGIILEGCPLGNPPEEIVAQGNEAILRYWAEKEFAPLNEAKVILVGDPNAGKTTLVRRMLWDTMVMPAPHERTPGIDIHKMEYQSERGEHYRLNIWDFAGQEVRYATHQFFFTERSIYILLDDTSENHVEAHDIYFRNWLGWIELLGGDSPIFIFQNEKGGVSRFNDFKGIQNRYQRVEGQFRGNLNDEGSADAMKAALQSRATKLDHIGTKWPVKWIKIRERLEQVSNEKAIIPYQDFLGICDGLDEKDDKSSGILSQFLHDLGVHLHFQKDDHLRHWVILQNQWATDAVYKLLADEQVKRDQNGRFRKVDMDRIWHEARYRQYQPVLVALMERFDLCYYLKDTEPKEWLIPQMLHPSEPDGLDFVPASGDLVVQYKYRYMPKGLISRLMTRHHRLVTDPNKSWRNGVLFEDGHAQLLATHHAEHEMIRLRAKGGRLDQLALMRSVSRELESIHALFSKIEVTKYIPCRCDTCKALPQPEMYKLDTLLTMFKRKRDVEKQCDLEPNLMVPVLELLDGFFGETKGEEAIAFLHQKASVSEIGDQFDELKKHIDRRFDHVDHSLEVIQVYAAILPDVINKLIGIKEYQSTIFYDLKAIGHRLETKVAQNHDDSLEVLKRIEGALNEAFAGMGELQRAEYEASIPKSSEYLETLVGKVKFKIPLIPLAYAIITHGSPESLVLLGTAMSRSLELDATIPEHAKGLIRVWDDIKFRIANMILDGKR